MKILVIDDDPAMTDLLEILLGSISSEIVAANSGQEGLEKAKAINPDIIILDVMMPDFDGCQLCTKIREFSKTPILILSALDSPGLVAQVLDAGADDYLVKPVTRNLLIAHLNRLITRSIKNKKHTQRISVPSHPN